MHRLPFLLQAGDINHTYTYFYKIQNVNDVCFLENCAKISMATSQKRIHSLSLNDIMQLMVHLYLTYIFD